MAKNQSPRNKPPQKPPRQPHKKSNKNPSFLQQFMLGITVMIIIVLIGSYLVESQGAPEEFSLSELAQSIEDDEIKSIEVEGEDLLITLTNDEERQAKKEVESSLTETLANYGVTPEELRDIDVQIQNPNGVGYWALNLLPILIPVLFIVLFIWFLSRQVKGAGMQAFTFGQSKARMTPAGDKKQRVTFKDVAGATEAKEELLEVVDFLKNPKKFIEIGARIPKGILLMGAPGTGKTLLARAVAGEAKVAFFSISGSEFVEMFVGVGASRVRDLFKSAKAQGPAIIFVDEIDAVGRARGAGTGGGNDEREQTLNQILVEMDGFEPNEQVIVMAATNRPDVLDTALLRPGRFDRRVTIDLPDRDGREAILTIHADRKPLDEDVEMRVIAERTPGFSGADLANLMNEAAILAAREERKKLSQFDLVRSIEKVMLGPERKTHVLNKKEKEITAYHEAGHALVSSMLPYADPVHKISIISRGRAAGYTLKLPIEDKKMHSQKEFKDDLAVSLAGYVTERMIMDDVTTGPSNDLQVSTSLARDMVTKYGMSEKIGTVALEGSDGQALFGKSVGDRDYSNKVGNLIDDEVTALMKEAYQRAEKILTEKRSVLDAIATALIDKESLERKEYESILTANGITLKSKEDIEHQS